MVTIVKAILRESATGKFVSLELNGDVELIQSMKTGRFYATAKRCFITSTFTIEQAQTLIGTQLPGTVVRAESDAYDYTVPETGEVIQLSHTYTYMPAHAQNEAKTKAQHMEFV